MGLQVFAGWTDYFNNGRYQWDLPDWLHPNTTAIWQPANRKNGNCRPFCYLSNNANVRKSDTHWAFLEKVLDNDFM